MPVSQTFSFLMIRGGALFIWMLVIFGFSSLHGSAYPSEPTLWYTLERKGAHIVEYAILTFLAIRFFAMPIWGYVWRQSVYIAVVFSLTYGALDELHQFFVPYRMPKMGDVLIDGIGILLVGASMLIGEKRFQKTLNRIG